MPPIRAPRPDPLVVRRAPRADAARNRERILAAAMEVFAADPVATVDEVAAAAGVGRATIHRHFPTRDELRQTVWLRALGHLREALAAADLGEVAPMPALDRMLEVILAESVAYRVLIRVGVEVDTEVDAAFEALLDQVGEVIDRARADGLVDDGLSTAWAADAWSGVVLVALEWVAAGRLDEPAAVDLVRRTVWAGVGTPAARRRAR
ncbi:MAG: TetR family transcriptional regulator [Acidimicrobiales bacterium]|nr:TetR family transcriptional regulator [Acidimicrobiales bacterium]